MRKCCNACRNRKVKGHVQVLLKKFGNFVCIFFENTFTLRQAKNITSNEEYVSRQNLTNLEMHVRTDGTPKSDTLD